MALLHLLALTFITVYVVDLSGWTDTWKGWLAKWLGVKVGRVRPFDCEKCLSMWVGIIYLLCSHQFTLGTLAFQIALSAYSPQLYKLLSAIALLFETLIYKLNKQIDKIWTQTTD